MTDQAPDSEGGLQFDRAEPAGGEAAQAAACGQCGQPLAGFYYQVNGRPICEKCEADIKLNLTSGSGTGRFARAALFGLGAALAGGAVWYAVRATTGYEVGLIAVLVGLMVGGAVRAGSRGRGGLLYQLLAVSLTYGGICAQYVPDLLKAIREMPAQEAAAKPAAPGAATPKAQPASETAAATPSVGGFFLALGLLFALALAAPFLGGFQSIIGILIIGFALWEAWKMNRRVPLQVEGPFRVGSPPTAPTAG